jgi:hypothetical protein
MNEKLLFYILHWYEYTDTKELNPESTLLHLLGKSTLLDPHYKLDFFSERFGDIISAQLLQEAAEQHHAFEADIGDGDGTAISSENDNATQLLKGRKRKLKDPSSKREDLELQNYTHSPTVKESEDPLLWWRVNGCNFPVLSRLAQKYLSMCATSAASERLFSISGNLVTSRRSSICPERVNKLVFLACNLK